MADNVTTAFLQFSGVQQNKRCKTFNFTLKCVHFLRFNCHAQKNTKFDATAVQPAVRFILAVWIAHMLFTCMHIAQPHRHLIARSFKAFAHSIRIAISMHFNTMWSKHDTRASKKTFHFFLSHFTESQLSIFTKSMQYYDAKRLKAKVSKENAPSIGFNGIWNLNAADVESTIPIINWIVFHWVQGAVMKFIC